MDVHLLDAEPTAAERDAVDSFLGPPSSSWVGADRVDDGHFRSWRTFGASASATSCCRRCTRCTSASGWISPGALNYIARRLTIPPADVYGVATFYAMFSLEPRPPRVLHVCDDVVCRCAGSESLIAMLTERLGPAGTELGGATWLPSPCLGQCDRAPAALLVESGPRPLERELTTVDVESLLEVMGGATPAPPRARGPAAGRPGGASLAGSDRRRRSRKP